MQLTAALFNELTTSTSTTRRLLAVSVKKKYIYIYIYVGGSSKIQTFCHMTQVLLKLRATEMERVSGY